MDVSPAAAWTLAGLALVFAEFVLPGVIVVFFGVAALIVAALLALGVGFGLAAQFVLFGVLSAVLVVLARSRVMAWMGVRSERASSGIDVFTYGAEAVVLDPFADGVGAVTYRGARWMARADEALQPGQRVYILGRQGLHLEVSSQLPATPNKP